VAADCPGGQCIQSYPGRVCTWKCSTGVECPSPWTCTWLNEGGKMDNACVPPADAPVGTHCGYHAMCATGYCVQLPSGAACAGDCSSECPEDWSCQLLMLPGGGLQDLCTPIPADVGLPCENDADCVEGLCVGTPGGGRFCSMHCAYDCPHGLVCKGRLGPGAERVCVHDANDYPGDIGEPCTSGETCQSGLCLETGGGAGVCTAQCPCPDGSGWFCAKPGPAAGSLCVPPDWPPDAPESGAGEGGPAGSSEPTGLTEEVPAVAEELPEAPEPPDAGSTSAPPSGGCAGATGPPAGGLGLLLLALAGCVRRRRARTSLAHERAGGV